jgi:hypothetical protein
MIEGEISTTSPTLMLDVLEHAHHVGDAAEAAAEAHYGGHEAVNRRRFR